MINSLDFYFEVSKDAKMATDGEGGYSECYLKLGFQLKTPMEDGEADDRRIELVDNALIGASNVLKIDKSLLKIISKEEYKDNTEDDEFDDYDEN